MSATDGSVAGGGARATSSLRTVAQAIEDGAKSTTTGYRFVDEEGRSEPFFSHAGIERASARFGGALQSMGLKKGDRVALILPDNADFVFAFLGAVRAGVVPVPIYPPVGLGKLTGYLDNTMHIVARSGARVLVTNGEIRRLLGAVHSSAPELAKIVDIDEVRSQRDELRPVPIGLDDPCFLQFTSGSTSRPKGVTLTHRNLAANVRAIMEQGLGISRADSGLSWLPLYHDMGLIGFVIAPLYHTTTITFLPPLLFLTRPVKWLEQMSQKKATVSFGPNFAYALCVKRVRDSELQGLDLSHWRVAGCGAEPIRAENLEAFASRFESVGFSRKAFVGCYGMAESTLAVSFSELGRGVQVDEVDGERLWAERKAVVVAAEPQRSESTDAVVASVVACGSAFPDHEVAVFSPDDDSSAHPLPERTVGELRLRGPSVMSGYWGDTELTRQAFPGGWLRTGDLGYLAGGKVHVCGRSKEVVIVNGRNYYPQDLEWEASRVDGVRKGNVIAFGTMKPTMDRERVVLVFETATVGPQRDALKGEVRKVVQQGVGLTVDDVVAVDVGALPKTSSGKLQRAKTRELYESGELLGRTNVRELDRVELAKAVVKSQIGFFRHALLGGASKDEG
jgi:fatty-acyl-CoA synthase